MTGGASEYKAEFTRLDAGSDAAPKIRLRIRNRGTAPWSSHDPQFPVLLGWHLSRIDGGVQRFLHEGRFPLPATVQPGNLIECDVGPVVAALEPGAYLIEFDLVCEHRFWFAEQESPTLLVRWNISRPAVPPRVEVRPEKWTATRTWEADQSGHYLFLACNRIAHEPLDLLVRIDGQIAFDWVLPPASRYLFGRELPRGRHLIEIEAAGTSRSPRDWNEVTQCVGLEPTYQPQVARRAAVDPVSWLFMAFYYPWFRTPLLDLSPDRTRGDWPRHCWDLSHLSAARHEQFPKAGYPLNASFWPLWGAHSSASRYIVEQDFDLLAEAGVGTVLGSWWPPATVEDANLALLLDVAAARNMRVAVLVEAFDNVRGYSADGPQQVTAWLEYLRERYFAHPAYLHLAEGPVVFEWASAWPNVKPRWRENLAAIGEFRRRHKCGLCWIAQHSHYEQPFSWIANPPDPRAPDAWNWSYNYEMYDVEPEHFPSDPLAERWMCSVGPGYDEQCLPRAWRAMQRYRGRDRGARYDALFEAIVRRPMPSVNVVSYNEFTEGTQIAPTLPRRDARHETEEHFGYSAGIASQFAYLVRTRYWIERLRRENRGFRAAVDRVASNPNHVWSPADVLAEVIRAWRSPGRHASSTVPDSGEPCFKLEYPNCSLELEAAARVGQCAPAGAGTTGQWK